MYGRQFNHLSSGIIRNHAHKAWFYLKTTGNIFFVTYILKCNDHSVSIRHKC